MVFNFFSEILLHYWQHFWTCLIKLSRNIKYLRENYEEEVLFQFSALFSTSYFQVLMSSLVENWYSIVLYLSGEAEMYPVGIWDSAPPPKWAPFGGGGFFVQRNYLWLLRFFCTISRRFFQRNFFLVFRSGGNSSRMLLEQIFAFLAAILNTF